MSDGRFNFFNVLLLFLIFFSLSPNVRHKYKDTVENYPARTAVAKVTVLQRANSRIDPVHPYISIIYNIRCKDNDIFIVLGRRRDFSETKKKLNTTPSIDTLLTDLIMVYAYWIYRSGKATVAAAEDLDNV